MCRLLTLAAAALLAVAASASALDQIRKTDGSTSPGNLRKMTPQKIFYELNGQDRELEVNQLVFIQYDGENPAMKTLRKYILERNYEEAVSVWEKISGTEASRAEIKADMQFYPALAKAKLALAGNGVPAESGRLLLSFLSAYPTSYHYFEAVELLGDLLVAAGNFAQAGEYYEKLSHAPWPDYQLRAQLGLGRALVAQLKLPEAQAAFDKVLTSKVSGDAADQARAAANLGKLRCLAQTGKPDDVIAAVEKLIAQTDAEKKEVMAPAYNVLGTALRKAKRNKEAIVAFLHVELLYSTLPDSHAEALANLAELWSGVQQMDRAARCRQTLEERYPNSPWAKKG